MNVQWIKLTTFMFDDDKIKLIESMPEKDTVLIIWIKLLIQAGKTNASGFIYLNERIPYSDEMLAAIFSRPISSVRLALDILAKFEMIERSDNGIFIANWDKHQNVKGLEELRAKNAERVKKHRDKKKTLELEYKKEDKDIDKEGNVTSNITPVLQKEKIYLFDDFWSAYPKKTGKKKVAAIYARIIKNNEVTHEELMNGVDSYKRSDTVKKGFIKNPETWLNGGCWADEDTCCADEDTYNIGDDPEQLAYIIALEERIANENKGA